MGITVSTKGGNEFSKTLKYIGKIRDFTKNMSNLDKYGREGVAALSAATPRDTGLTASSWGYTIEKKTDSVTISFTNSNIQNGVPIAVILQYGHGTRNGGWVEGRDYINPAIRPIFDRILSEAWKEVSGL